MVKVNNLAKSFGKLTVLNRLNLHIPEGKSVAVLGPNGSGKTTLIKCILGMVLPDTGEIFVKGQPVKNNWNYRHTIGYLPQIARLPENLTVEELLDMICDIRQSGDVAGEWIKIFKLTPYLNKSLRYLSGGTRQKVNVILSLMFNPDLYVFDEPTVGLDPVSRVTFKECVQHRKEEGKTILLTTHLMNEVEELADDIIFLLDGNVFYHGSPHELMNEQKESSLERAIATMLIASGHE